MGYTHQLVRYGMCISVQEANAKVAAFRDWLIGLPVEEAAAVNYLRERLGRNTIWQLGPNGIDEIIASLLLFQSEAPLRQTSEPGTSPASQVPGVSLRSKDVANG